ncbi:GNAT family N-acetyltransferase [Okeania sp.]|uniref:GNAT family N-acetyltransferase n=1 Tax=Okeania sp. TaxID=3100323 RepID=UPI002B4ABBCC|nr:GNAT family N-acetyltransferase [Okeania sp.]MEB3342776.1 GNAT family N-acetyltransferase [Okeania sp.]
MNINQDNFIVRPMTLADLKLAISWAANEGWNPGIDDVNNFYVADPEGFLIGELNGEPISCISMVRYSKNFNFVGIYIVKPEWRKKGYGFRTWQEAFKLINNQSAALDAVLEQVNTYRKSGFEPAHSHLRYQGIIPGKISPDIQDLKTVNFEKICSYDSLYFPAERSNFLKSWINQPNGKSYGIINDGNLIGYGVIRKAQEGFKIGPIFAENREIAEKLFLALCSYSDNQNVYIDVPNINQPAINLVEDYQMQCVFECVRMYSVQKPNLDWQNIFGVTSLELG